MPNIYDVAAQFRAALVARDAAAAARIVEAYGQVYARLSRDIATLAARIAAAQAAGEPLGVSWAYQQARLINLRQTIAIEVRQFAAVVADEVLASQSTNVRLAVAEARSLAVLAVEETTPGLTATFVDPDPSSLRSLVGFLSDGSPLRSLLDELPLDAVRRIEGALVEGVATGRNPRETARKMRSALGGNVNRALTIARTESLRAYRETSRATYAANADVVRGWVWHSARDSRTCAVCWAMHGTEFENREPLGSHPNCRCALVPQTATWEELGVEGLPDTRPKVDPGPKAFARLPKATQKRILGPGKFDLYERGEIDLPDLVVRRDDPRWGPSRQERPLRALRS